MLISHTHKFIFIKTVKTAGTTIELAFQHACAPSGAALSENTPTIETEAGVIAARGRIDGSAWKSHMAAKGCKRVLDDIEKWSSYFIFSSVRNPFDQAVSQYNFLKKQKNTLGLGKQARLMQEDLANSDDAEGQHASFGRFLHNRDFSLSDHISIDGELVVTDAIRFEELRNDTKRIGEILGIDVDTKNLPHAKNIGSRSKALDMSDYFTEETVAFILQKERLVFERFEYDMRPAGM